jgi:hypothetical protein
MENVAPKFILSSIAFCLSAMVRADICLPIQGTIQTQSISQTEQVGSITMTSSNLKGFKKAFGEYSITGGIHGVITGSTATGGIIVDHRIGFPEVGTIISNNDVATFTGAPDETGNIPVLETAPLSETTGKFRHWTAAQPLVATGTVNFTTGSNTFVYTGSICKKHDH